MAELIAQVGAYPSRSAVVSLSRQPECGYGELTEYWRDQDQRSDAVTLAECVSCVSDVGPN